MGFCAHHVGFCAPGKPLEGLAFAQPAGLFKGLAREDLVTLEFPRQILPPSRPLRLNGEKCPFLLSEGSPGGGSDLGVTQATLRVGI